MIARFSIRSLLLLLVAAFSVPVLALLGFIMHGAVRQSVAETQSTARMLSVVAAADVGRVIRTNRDFLEQMAARPLIRALDPERCDPVLREFRELFPIFANMFVVERSGRLFCSAVPEPGGKPVSAAKADWFREAVAKQRFLAGKPLYGRITGKWVSVLTYPIRDDSGQFAGVIGLPIDLTHYRPNLAGVALPAGTTVGIQGADGMLVWRNIDAEKWMGKNVADLKAARDLLRIRDGLGEGIGLDGVHRLYAVKPVQDADWFVFVGIPSEPAYARAYRELGGNLLMFLAALIVVVGFATVLARRIARPVRELAAAARAVRNGDMGVRVAASGPPEIKDVAAEFNEMLEARSKIEQALRASEAKLSEAVQIARLGYWEYEVANVVFVFNDQYYSLHRTSAQEVGGYRLSAGDFMRRFVHPDDVGLLGGYVREAIATADAGFLAQTEARILCADGEVRWVQVRFKIEKDGEGRTVKLIGTNQDISERKRAEDAVHQLNQSLERRVGEELAKDRAKDGLLIQQSRLATMGEMMHNVAHQWRQPLSVLNLILHNIEDEYESGELNRESLSDLVSKGNRVAQQMSDTIDDFRNFFRPSEDRTRFNLKDSVDHALSLVQASFEYNRIEARVEAPVDVFVDGFPNEFAHVLLNVLINAKDAIEAGETAEGRIAIGIEGNGGVGLVRVRDNGGGIPADVLPKVFDPYFTTKDKGSGIGLYMSRMIVEHMQGHIDAHNVPGGAEIVISIPVGGVASC